MFGPQQQRNAAAQRPQIGATFRSFGAIAITSLAAASAFAGSASAEVAAGVEFALAIEEATESTSAESTVELSATRTEGVAPLSIFFDTNGTVVSGIEDPFHHALFEWNFGDAEAGTWTTSGRSKNTAAGPLAHHVYETPGVYTATVKVRDAEGRIAQKSVEITVTDPNEVFAGENTVCLSTSGDFEGCPEGASQVTSNGQTGDVAAQIGSSRRVLLRRGERWSGGRVGIPEDASTGILGAYGEGDAPQIQHAGGTLIETDGNDFRIMDLHFISSAVPATAIGHGPGDDALVLGCTMDGYKYGFGEANGGGDDGLNFAAVDNTIGELSGGRGGYGAFLRGIRLGFQGNVVEDATRVEHSFRSSNLVQAVISHNDLGPPARTKTAMKLHAYAVGSNRAPYAERILVSDNILRGYYQGWTAVFGPQNAEKDERVRDLIFERNHIISNAGGVGVVVTASRITVRNNVIDMTGGGPATCVSVFRRGIEPPPDGVYLYNNTCYSRGSGAPRLASVSGASSNVVVKNNLTVSHDSGEPFTVGDGDNITAEANVATTGAVFVSDEPAATADFALRAGAEAIDVGVTPPGAAVDMLGRDVAVDGSGDGSAEYDAGASEFAAE